MPKLPLPRPLSIKVISITDVLLGLVYIVASVFLVRAVRGLLAGFEGMETDRLAFGLFTLLAYGCNLFFLGVVGPSIGIGLWRIGDRGRWVAIVYHAWWILSYLLACSFSWTPVYVLPGPGWNTHQQQWGFTILAIPVLAHLASLWFLISRKAAFDSAVTPSEA